MRPRALATLIAALWLTLLAASTSAASPVTFIPCPHSTEYSCASLSVPLERGGAVQGSLALAVERRLAGSAPSRDAVVALAGGPGQATLPLAEFIPKAIAPALGSRDLLLMDQRGTGASDPLGCSALERFSTEPVARLFEQCAQQIGPARGAFTTAESVQDIEALRVAGGYEKLVLYGTSYGTKLALEYAERYPQQRRGAHPGLRGALQRLGTVPPGVLRRHHAGAARTLLGGSMHGHHLQRGRRPRDARRAPAGARADGLGLRRHRRPALEHRLQQRPAGHPGGGRPEPRAARAAAGGGDLRAAGRPPAAPAPAPARRGADPQHAVRRRRRIRIPERDRRSPVLDDDLRGEPLPMVALARPKRRAWRKPAPSSRASRPRPSIPSTPPRPSPTAPRRSARRGRTHPRRSRRRARCPTSPR